MRPLQPIFGLAVVCFLAVSNAKSDVIVGNTSTQDGLSTGDLLIGDRFSIQFTVDTGKIINLTSISLFRTTGSSDVVDFKLTNGSSTFTNSGIFATSSGGVITFAFTSAISGADLTSGPWTLDVGSSLDFLVGGYETTSGSINQSNFTNTLSQTLIETGTLPQTFGKARFILNGVAVPEPGTMAFGAIALASGGLGTWWRRRKAKATREA